MSETEFCIKLEDGSWMCKKCRQIDYCCCLGDMEDPICQCGYPAYACSCKEDLEDYEYE